MSFDLFLCSFENGDAGTGNPAGLCAFLKAKKVVQLEMGFANIETADGGSCEMYGPGNDERLNVMFALRGGWTRGVSEFIFDAAVAGEMTILDNQSGKAILVSEAQRAHLPDELRETDPPPIVCRSAEEMELLLRSDYDAWRSLRNRIVKE